MKLLGHSTEDDKVHVLTSLDGAVMCRGGTQDWDYIEDIDTCIRFDNLNDSMVEICEDCIEACHEADKFSFFYWLVRWIAPDKEEVF